MVTNFGNFWNTPYDPVVGEVVILGVFVIFETLKWSFRTQNLKPQTIKLKVLKMVQTPTPQTQIPKRLTKQTNYSDNRPSFL